MAEKTKAEIEEAELLAEIEAEDEARAIRRDARRAAWGVTVCTSFVCAILAMTGAALWMEWQHRDRAALMLEVTECQAARLNDLVERVTKGGQ